MKHGIFFLLVFLLTSTVHGWQGGFPASAIDGDDLRLNSLGVGTDADGTEGNITVTGDITASGVASDLTLGSASSTFLMRLMGTPSSAAAQ